MEKGEIYIENEYIISFSDVEVEISGKALSDDEKKDNETWEAVATRLRKVALHKHLKRQYENTIILTGAGSSYQVGVGEKKGKLMRGLWEEAVKQFSYSTIKEICEIIHFQKIQSEDETTNIEELLTHAQFYQRICENNETVNQFISDLKEMVKNCCTLDLPNNNPHQKFLKKLVSKKMKYTRPKIFTLNYDTLFEQAAEENGYMIIDGFSFNFPRKFKGTNFDLDVVTRITNKSVLEDNFTPNVVHIYKPHGSIDWAQDGDDVIKKETDKSLMIYPSSNKYESSYQQPFFEMMSRFQQETRAKNTLLIIIGYSFGDEHINAMISEALNVNPSITVIFVSPDACEKNEKYKMLRDQVSVSGNVVLTKQTFEEFVNTYPQSEIYAQNEVGDYND
ncbi:TPA: SIR2 family protein [Listeria innocua]|nr:SIR2 family protein [Listeria grayi]HBM3601704.1 SIR2 family protein [Listeria innocua]